MRQITQVQTIVKYNELNEDQKTKVINNLRDINVDHDWFDFTYEDTKTILEFLGFSDVKIQFSGFSSQGDGASFTGKFKVSDNVNETKDRIKAVKEYTPHIKLFEYGMMRFNNEEWSDETLLIKRISHRYSHSGTISSDNKDLTKFVRDFSNELYKTLEKEYDYLTSRKCIEETIEANEYEFDLETLKIV